MTDDSMTDSISKLQDIIGTDAGDRGMKALIVPGDLMEAAKELVVGHSLHSDQSNQSVKKNCIVILSGFPCCVAHTPPTETDGPPGACAIARAAVALHSTKETRVVIVTDECNEEVFAAACQGIDGVELVCFSSDMSKDREEETKLQKLIQDCTCLIACERAGPASDGICYTMRGIDMNAKGLIAPLHRFVTEKSKNVKFLAIGDGGNELGMGKVYDKIVNNPKIPNGPKIACAVSADYLIAASVSNWGGYALAAAAAIVKANQTTNDDSSTNLKHWLHKCLPTDQDEIDLLNRCVAKGCRDGVSGQIEATVDGMPLETSLQCLRDLRNAAMAATSTVETS